MYLKLLTSLKKICGRNSATWQWHSADLDDINSCMAHYWRFPSHCVKHSAHVLYQQLELTAACSWPSLLKPGVLQALQACFTVQNIHLYLYPHAKLVKMPVRVVAPAVDFCVLFYRRPCNVLKLSLTTEKTSKEWNCRYISKGRHGSDEKYCIFLVCVKISTVSSKDYTLT